MQAKKIYIVVISGLLSLFVVVQFRSFENVSDLLLRDSQSSIFQEIKILKEKNEDLKAEIAELEMSATQLNDQNSALDAVEEEIKKYSKLSGGNSIFGPGINIVVDAKVTTPWMVDMVNELFNSGAQAVSVNGIRIVNNTAGFDTLPQGQMLLNGSILSPPYRVDAIGESSNLSAILQLPGGIIERLKASVSDLKMEITAKDIIKME